MAATIIKNGRIHDAVHREAYVADILLADGKIAAIGGGLTAPADAAVFDADGLEVYPGFVDAHTHIGLDGYGKICSITFTETPINKGIKAGVSLYLGSFKPTLWEFYPSFFVYM